MNRLESIKNEIYYKNDGLEYYSAREDIEYLLQRLEKYEEALEKILKRADHMNFYDIKGTAEEALKE